MKSCQININKEIKILKDLKHNWYWNEGREYSKIELKYISLFLLEFNKHFLIKNTRVYPTINNEIELEWCNSLFDISIKFKPRENGFMFCILDLTTSKYKVVKIKRNCNWWKNKNLKVLNKF